jgi:WD40 repeat protein
VRLWESKAGRLRARLTGHRDEVYGVAFSPRGDLLASTSFDGTIRLWDPAKGVPVDVLSGAQGYAFRVAFSPDGVLLAAARQLTEKESEVELWNLAFSPDGRTLLSGGKDQAVRVWEVGTGRLVQVLRHARPVTAAIYAPDGRTMIVNDWKAIKVYPVIPPVWTRDPRALLALAEQEAGLQLAGHTLRPTR